jgi:hypothetical protein
LERGEKSEQLLEVVILLQGGFGCRAARHFGAVQVLDCQQIRGQIGVEIVSGIREGCEEQYFLVARVNRCSELAQNEQFQMLQLGIVGGRDLVHRCQGHQ